MPKRILFACCILAFSFLVGDLSAQEEKASSIKLPQRTSSSAVSLVQALEKRKSTREFKEKDLSWQVISDLLWAANGINRPDSGMRTAPSAKNAQEIDIYVAMKNGLYLYDPKIHALDLIVPQDVRRLAGIQGFAAQAPVDLIFVSDLDRIGGPEDIAMFYSATDTGYVSQNVYLFCAAEGLATVVLGWIDKETLSKAMNLKPTQRIILAQPVGYPR